MVSGGAVILIGGPGVGKTTLGRYLQQRNALTTRFLSVSRREPQRQQQPQETNDLQGTAQRRGDARRRARELVRAEVQKWATNNFHQTGSARRPRAYGAPVLLLECVDEIGDAFWVTQLLQEHGIPLLQVLYIPANITLGTEALFDFRVQSERARLQKASTKAATTASATAAAATGHGAGTSSSAGGPRAATTTTAAAAVASGGREDAAADDDSTSFTDRIPSERQATWSDHTGRLLEFFSGLDVLSEVVPSRVETSNLTRMGYGAAMPYSRDMEPKEAYSRRRGKQSAAAVERETDRRSVFATMTAVRPAWLCTAGWLLPRGLAVTPLQPVTSSRLVTCAAEREWVLTEVTRTSGLKLCSSGSGGPGNGGADDDDDDSGDSDDSATGILRLPVPSPTAPVTSSADVRWLSAPGRYAMTHGSDGTRHLLLAVRPRPPSFLTRRETRPVEGAAAADTSGAQPDGGGGSGDEAAVYLLNSIGTLYAFPLRLRSGGDGGSGPAPGLPAGTVLDGELLWLGGRGFFVASDAICLGHERLWARPLRERLAALATDGLGLTEAEAEAELREAAAAAAAAAPPAIQTPIPKAKNSSPGAELPLRKQQQASPRGSDAVLLLRKQHLPVSSEMVRRLDNTRPYPTDGLVFTPYDMPYVLGMAELQYRWRPADGLRTEFDGMPSHMPKVRQPPLVKALVYELYDTPRAGAESGQPAVNAPKTPGGASVSCCPISVRWDCVPGMRRTETGTDTCVLKTYAALADSIADAEKQRDVAAVAAATFAASADGDIGNGNDGGAIPAATVEEGGSGPGDADGDAVSGGDGGGGGGGSAVGSAPLHPARCMPYDELYDNVIAAVEAGAVERTVDRDTGLEIFWSCRRPGADPPGPVEALCRGLVLHPPSRAVVATPLPPILEWSRSREPQQEEERPDKLGAATAYDLYDLYRLTGLAAVKPQRTLLPYDEDLEEMVGERRGRPSEGGPQTHGSNGLRGSTEAADPRVTETDDESDPAPEPAVLAGEGGDTRAVSGACGSPSGSSNSGSSSCSGISSSSGGGGLVATAAVKVDGWPVVVFTWDGHLRTAFQGRLDSEPALWAADWLRRNANAAAFQPGWTYMLEAVYDARVVVVPYTFEGLVLVGAFDPRGAELPVSGLSSLAVSLGVTMAVPYITGPLYDMFVHLPGFRPRDWKAVKYDKHTATTTNVNLEPPSFEGWVLTAATPESGADSIRGKLVQLSYKRTAIAPYLLHPLAVWDLVRNGGASRDSIARGLPPHFRRELRAILAALETGYSRARSELLLLMRRLHKERRRYEELQQEAQQRREQQEAQQRREQQEAEQDVRGAQPQGSVPSQQRQQQQRAAANAGASRGSHARQPTAGAAPAAPAAAAEAAPSVPAAGSAAAAAGRPAAGVPTAPPPTAHAALPPTPSWDMEQLVTLMAARREELDSELSEEQQHQHQHQQQRQHQQETETELRVACRGSRGRRSLSGGVDSLYDSTAFQRAVHYTVNRMGNGPVVDADLAPNSVFYDRSMPRAGAPSLRGLLLDCVLPGEDGSLSGYCPSPAFSETWVKRWTAGPAVGRMAPAEPPLLHVRLLDELLERCLAPLAGRDVVTALRVCWKWRRVLEAAMEPQPLAARLAEGRRAAAAAAVRKIPFDDTSDSDDYYEYGYCDFYDDYGSDYDDDDDLLYNPYYYEYDDGGDDWY